MNVLIKKLRYYPLSSVLIAITWILCFATVPRTPLHDITLMDKWTHIVMYAAICMAIWHEYGKNHDGERPKWMHLILWAWIMPLAMGCLIELLQAYCTGGRRYGDWIDVAANSVGCTIALVAGVCITWRKQTRSRMKKK